MSGRSFLKNNFGGLNIFFPKIPIHFNNYVQHRQNKKMLFFIFLFFKQTFQPGRLSSSSRRTHLGNHFTFSSSVRTQTFEKITYKKSKAFFNKLTLKCFNSTINLIETSKVPLEHKFLKFQAHTPRKPLYFLIFYENLDFREKNLQKV